MKLSKYSSLNKRRYGVNPTVKYFTPNSGGVPVEPS
jgi:hypothetical protein